jgi:hypothetical protein
MKKYVTILAALAVVACAGSEKTETDSAAAATPTVGPAALDLASLAGKWTQVVRAEGSDSILVTSELNAGADASSWTIKLPGREPQPVRVTVSGDSVMTEVGPYESVLRKGVQVTTSGVARLVDGKLVGTTIARYSGAGADSVVRMRTEATRTP